MQWDSTPYSGFTSKTDGAWMRTHDLYKEINVAAQVEDPASVLNFWKRLIKIRKEYRDLFIHGRFESFDMQNQETFVFGKTYGKYRAIVALNFADSEQPFRKPQVEGEIRLLVSNLEGVDGTEKKLMPYEGRIYLAN